MRFDPTVEVICDECGAEVHWSPEYVYNDWSGTSGHYDISDDAFEQWKKSEGWGGDDERDTCDTCAINDDSTA